jgi:hypothetical protein
MSENEQEAATATNETQSHLHLEGKRTAADKLRETLRELSKPDADAGELGLMLASLAMAVESTVGSDLEQYQQNGEIDDFVLSLCRFIAIHRSDDVHQLLVVELPRMPEGRELPAGTRLHALDVAAQAAQSPTSPLW